jgi:hypothetical protein
MPDPPAALALPPPLSPCTFYTRHGCITPSALCTTVTSPYPSEPHGNPTSPKSRLA